MDIAGVSMVLAQNDIQSKIGIAVLDKALDMNEIMGAGLAQMMDAAAMEQSVNPNIGAIFDVRV